MLDMSEQADYKKYNDVVIGMMKLQLKQDLKQLKFEFGKLFTYIIQDVFTLHGCYQLCVGVDKDADAAQFPAWFPQKYIKEYCAGKR